MPASVSEILPLLPIAQSDFGGFLLWTAVVVAAMVAMAVFVTWLRRQLFHSEDVTDNQPFMLDDLRQLRDSGQISEEEYERARDRLLGSIRGQMPEPTEPRAEESDGQG